jgi:signal transduction histidine kinase/ligand-binding sensor domain-containing protein
VMENGLPQNTVQALVQGKDGYIWLGTEAGLVRFDGMGFQVFDRTTSPSLPGNDVQCLLAASDGSLWVGTSEGLARWQNGAVTVFDTTRGLPSNDVRSLVESDDGLVWAWTGEGLARLDTDRFVDSTTATRFAAAAINGVTSNGRRELWVTSSEDFTVYRKGRWEWAHMVPPIAGGSVDFVQAFRDNSAIASKNTVEMLHGGNLVAKLGVGSDLPGSRIQVLLYDREGTLWIGTNGGLARWADGKLERLPITDPLASASVLALIEDHEGNLWAGTEVGGLHILRDQRFRTLTARRGLTSDNTTAVVEDAAGTLWVGTAGGGLDALPKDGAGSTPVRAYSVRDGLPSDVILSLAAAGNGDVWVGTPDGLGQIRNGRVNSFTSADGLPDDFIRSLLAEADGSLWIGTRHGLTHWAGSQAEPSKTPKQTYTQTNGLGSDLVGAMARGREGDLWVATFAGLSRLHAGRIANYTTADGLSSNVITALLAREDGTLLIGTEDRGWNLWDGAHFSRVQQAGLDRTSIHAILDDGLGHLWFATGAGVARCDCGGVMKRMQGADCSNWLEFGTADGLVSRETATNSHPSAWRSRDGRLWFATPKGVEEVDPAHFPVNTLPPPVVLERFAVDDVAQSPGGKNEPMRIPAGRNHFQFEYAGLSFVAPQKVRYRFMLEGFDKAWTEAGTRRTAYYTNIPPGHYTFRVQAANNDGLWNAQGAALQFELQPHFYQTLWFYILLALAVAGLVMLALRLRLVRAEREFRAVLGERNRIAREIHDTLAQGYVGISVQLELLSELLRHNKVDAAAKHLDTTRGFVREGLAEARQSIWSLRSQDATETTLPVRVRRLVEQAEGHGLEAKFSLYGAYRPMPPGTEQEFLRVAQEAIHNVKKHAGAKNLAVQLEYGPAEIALEVRDDGRGFAVSPVAGNGTAPDSPPGHYGLTGMKERATAVGGTLEVTSEAGQGTTVRLRAPAAKVVKERA